MVLLGMMADEASWAGPRVAAGEPVMDEQAFQTFYGLTAPRLRSFLLRAVGQSALADDLLQDSFLRFLKSGFVGEDETHRTRFLFKIATNLVRDHFRSRARRSETSIDEEWSLSSPSHDLDRGRDVRSAFARLGPRDRTLLWLAYVEGSSHQEIAEDLGLSPGSMKSLLFRARRRLASLIAKPAKTVLEREGR